MTTLYGINNCDTIKKARRWLDSNKIDYQFHDVRKDGISPTLIQQWIDIFGWEKVLNKRGTTWRKLSQETQNKISETQNTSDIVALLIEHPAMIKRPVLDTGKTVEIGFKEERYQELLSNNR